MKAEANQAGLRQCRLAAEDAQEHFREALKLGANPTALNALLTEARMVDYAVMRYIYAAGIGGFWKKCTKNPSPKNVRSLLALETASKYHARISDLLDEITELREKFREFWLNEYTAAPPRRRARQVRCRVSVLVGVAAKYPGNGAPLQGGRYIARARCSGRRTTVTDAANGRIRHDAVELPEGLDGKKTYQGAVIHGRLGSDSSGRIQSL